tara:strand:- start:610 stop:1302 length:693 start_codon:yes stop_codon:yes gene_type:complete
MASKRKYAYYIKGNKIAIIEEGLGSGVCSLAGYSSQSTCEAAGGSWTENAFSKDDGKWLSPIATVSDGLEIQYAYTPNYRINDIDDKSTAITGYDESSGLLKFTGSGLSTDAAITHIVISGSDKWNGLHKINTLNTNYWIVETKYNGTAVTESVTAYTDISVLEDESFELDLSRYQANALVYYLKAKLAEDVGEMDMREFFMREFKRQLEKSTSALKRGPYMVQGFKQMR